MTYQEENRKLIELFKPCRVTDVRDGMDWSGYHHYGTVDWRIRPLFRHLCVAVKNTLRGRPCIIAKFARIRGKTIWSRVISCALTLPV